MVHLTQYCDITHYLAGNLHRSPLFQVAGKSHCVSEDEGVMCAAWIFCNKVCDDVVSIAHNLDVQGMCVLPVSEHVFLEGRGTYCHMGPIYAPDDLGNLAIL